MPSLKSLKMRITSVKSTQKITKAMKMVAAAKLRRAQEAAEAARPYSVRMAAVMASLASRVTVGPESPRLLAGTGKDQVHLLVVCSSERGLAGGFNSNIAKLARRTHTAFMKSLAAPAGYKPVIDPARKLMATPTPLVGGTPLYAMPEVGEGGAG
jgi:F-type H+-transporting ATPase subunit gamma